MRKKLLAVVLAAAMAVCLMVCGGSSSGSAASTGEGSGAASGEGIRLLNGKPEIDTQLKNLAAKYKVGSCKTRSTSERS